MMYRFLRPLAASCLAWPLLVAAGPSDIEQLGRQIFFDTALSEPAGQACGSCHVPKHAFSDPIKGSPTSRGATPTLFGSRNAPPLAYTGFTPPLQAIGEDDQVAYMGGQFRDGRVDRLEDQARGPLFNPIEMANPDLATLAAKLRTAPYASLFRQVFGKRALNDDAQALDFLTQAVSAFERSHVFSPFSSKYDAWQRGQATLEPAEARGLALFSAPDKGNCASCHAAVSARPSGLRPLFTDFGYDNVGVPRNPANPFYAMPPEVNPAGRDFVDLGLGSVVPRDFTRGQFKAPTLRNIAITGPYMHNGYFKTLRGVVEFYNSRDVRPVCPDPFTTEARASRLGCWPVAEVPETVNRNGMGALGLSAQEVDDIVAFLGTLTDGWQAPVAARR